MDEPGSALRKRLELPRKRPGEDVAGDEVGDDASPLARVARPDFIGGEREPSPRPPAGTPATEARSTAAGANEEIRAGIGDASTSDPELGWAIDDQDIGMPARPEAAGPTADDSADAPADSPAEAQAQTHDDTGHGDILDSA